ncbi:hypothetical protein OJ997_04050 [Solirubrobacter phytolaccae]|uniref:Uncharacterized protein n=1 Tax=Solirubrobacter phytolaccae TaxID=1404360 RepID=A0A9X3NB53_9ACTN|nr:hypothetical protein [Solirubrobacter phytolaccae]MDA0179457.1 hypothetical protein [Solirubrobacter phytolaccae]
MLRAACAVLAAVVMVCAAPAAHAQTKVTIADREPAVSPADGSYTVSVTLTNVTEDDLPVTAISPADGCGVTLTGSPVDAASTGTVKLTFDRGCAAADLELVTLQAGGQSIELAPKYPAAETTDWDELRGFAWAFLGSAGLMLLLGLYCWRVPWVQLAGLPDTWKFGDSLVTNVTLLGGTLTAVVGSADVVKAFLGPDADKSIALITVGAAVSAAIIALGAVVLFTFRWNGNFTLFGLLAAAAVTLAGAGGELAIITRSARELTLGGWEGRIETIAYALAVLLVLYSLRSLKEAIDQGLTEAAPVKLSGEIVAAAVIVAATSDKPIDARELLAAIRAVRDKPEVGADAVAPEPSGGTLFRRFVRWLWSAGKPAPNVAVTDKAALL